MGSPSFRDCIIICGDYHTYNEKLSAIHTTPEGFVTKIEIEKKIKGKKEWSEFKLLEKRQ
jgi:hypothetical protein